MGKRRLGTTVCVLAALFALVAGTAWAQSAFVKVGPETVYDAQDRCSVPYWSVADFNGDGKPDIFIPDQGQDFPPALGTTPRLALSTPTGYIDASATLAGLPPTFSHSAAVADIEANGSPDVFASSISCCTGDKLSYILVNDGQGRFTRTQANLPAYFNDWAGHRRLQVDATGDFRRRPPIELPPGLFGGGWITAGGVQAPGPATINLDARAVDINGDG
jgi:hypothetical protein